MIKLDVAKAAFAGFGVIGRNPLAVLVWGIVLLVVGVLPAAGLVGGFISTIAELVAQQEAGVEPSPEAMMPVMSAMMALYPILFLTSIALRAVLGGAVFRAVLEPENRSWFYLRVGAQELWLALVTAVFAVFIMIASCLLWILVIPGVVIGYLAAPDNPAVVALVTVPLVLAGCGVVVWLALRFSMAFPMTFAERKFLLFESWSFTRGQSLNLFLLGLLLVAIALVIEIAIWALIAVIAAVAIGASASTGLDETAVEAFFRQDPGAWMAQLAPWLIVAALLACVVGAGLVTIFTAPWAEAYRQLRAGSTPTPVAEPDSLVAPA